MTQLFMKIIRSRIKLLKNRKRKNRRYIKDHKGDLAVVKRDSIVIKTVKIRVLSVFSNKIKCVHVAP